MILRSAAPISGFEMLVDRGKAVVNSICSMQRRGWRDLLFQIESQVRTIELPVSKTANRVHDDQARRDR